MISFARQRYAKIFSLFVVPKHFSSSTLTYKFYFQNVLENDIFPKHVY